MRKQCTEKALRKKGIEYLGAYGDYVFSVPIVFFVFKKGNSPFVLRHYASKAYSISEYMQEGEKQKAFSTMLSVEFSSPSKIGRIKDLLRIRTIPEVPEEVKELLRAFVSLVSL